MSIYLHIGLGCSDGTVDQTFTDGKMVGCDGSYTRHNFQSACSAGWHAATAAEYFAFGGQTTAPTKDRWVDVTWDSTGQETGLANWNGYFDRSNSGGWTGVSSSSTCFWISTNETCHLSFSNKDYGKAYGCHCRGGNTYGTVCAKDSGNILRLVIKWEGNTSLKLTT